MIRIPSRRDVLKTGGALALGATVGAGPVSARDTTAREKELYELAKKEGEITWYTAHSNDTTAQALGRDFEAAFPGIKANVVRTTAQVAYQRLTQEQRASAMQVDVFSSTDIGHYVALKEKNLLEKYVPDNASKVIDVYKNYDPDGFYTVTSAGLIAIAYNTAKLKEADAPKNWSDLHRSQMEGQDRARASGLLRLCRHLGGEPEEALRLGLLREAREEQSADRPLDQRHHHHAQRRRAHRRGLRSDRHRDGKRQQGQSARHDLSARRLGADHRAVRHPEGRQASERRQAVHGISAQREASQIWVEHFNESMRPEVKPLNGAKSAADVKTIRPTVEEIAKGIPEVIKQWRDTFGV